MTTHPAITRKIAERRDKYVLLAEEAIDNVQAAQEEVEREAYEGPQLDSLRAELQGHKEVHARFEGYAAGLTLALRIVGAE